MQIYLPIADIPVNIFLLLGMGLAVGFISGMFGIGGGFLMTPLLIFIGILPAVAVATVSSHIAASSASSAISYWRKKAIDIPLALMLLAGGIVGTAGGVWIFTLLRSADLLDLVIALSYLVLLVAVGGMMVSESVRAIVRSYQGYPVVLRRPGSHTWLHGLPFKRRFKRSKIYVSAIPVLGIGFIIGGVFSSGLYATGPVAGAKFNYKDATPEELERARKIEAVCKRHGVPLAAAALQFPLHHPNVASVIPGGFKPEHVAANVKAMQHAIPDALWAELKHEKLIRADAPTP